GAVYCYEAGAEALQAREVLVAGGLVDGALGAELGLQRAHRDAVGFHAAVAATLAHRRIDEDALVRVGEGAALAAATLLGGAGLVVDQHRPPGDLAQLLLHALQVVTVVDGHAGRYETHGVLVRFVCDHHHPGNALGQHLARDHRHGDAAVERLAAGHRHGVV